MTHTVVFVCLHGSAKSHIAVPPGLTIERWDDVPAVSENFKAARDAIVARLPRLLAECQ